MRASFYSLFKGTTSFFEFPNKCIILVPIYQPFSKTPILNPFGDPGQHSIIQMELPDPFDNSRFKHIERNNNRDQKMVPDIYNFLPEPKNFKKVPASNFK